VDEREIKVHFKKPRWGMADGGEERRGEGRRTRNLRAIILERRGT
jgi:hypothetical protein